MSIFENIQQRYQSVQQEEMSFQQYLQLCKKDPSVYANAAERMLKAIGEPELTDTSKDPRLGKIFSNKIIKTYPTFHEFYGMEETIEQIVSYFKHAAQGLEEKKQILYLLGPVGGGKSSLAEKLKQLMETMPFYAIKGSPVFESPLNVFDIEKDGQMVSEQFNIPKRYLNYILSPWAVKRLNEFKGDISKFRVVKMYPSRVNQIAIAKTEPGDENNQDISSLVGKVDIRQLEQHSQNDPDAYSFSGGLCHGNQGILEFVEMFKAPIKVLHPLLTATQEGNYNSTEGMGAIPYSGIILAHSNESEWETFRNNKTNEAFIDRVNTIKVPYCLQLDEEIKIYKKMLSNSSLSTANYAPNTLKILAEFITLSRIKEPIISSIYSKMKIYNGENLKDSDPNAKSIPEYKKDAGINEGMDGLSTRFAFKILSQVFNFDPDELAANPIHLLYTLEKQIKQQQFSEQVQKRYMRYIKEYLTPKYVEFLGKEIQTAYLESYTEYGQSLFDRYMIYADFWIQDQEYREPETGHIFNTSALNDELIKIEKNSKISDIKEFRNQVVSTTLRLKANNDGQNPSWLQDKKMRNIIEKNIFSSTNDILPVISFNTKSSQDNKNKHNDFVNRMVFHGYTKKQVRLLSEWYIRTRKAQ